MRLSSGMMRLALAVFLAMLFVLPAATVVSADGQQTCTTDLVIFSTSLGDVTQAGPVTIYRNSGIGGTYTSGFLAGSTISGSQDITMNTNTNISEIHGNEVVTSPDGSTLTIRYDGKVDLNTASGLSHFTVLS